VNSIKSSIVLKANYILRLFLARHLLSFLFIRTVDFSTFSSKKSVDAWTVVQGADVNDIRKQFYIWQ